LELYKNSIEINKNYYYLLFLKKEKQNLSNAGLLPLFSPGSAQPAHPRARPTCAHSRSPALGPASGPSARTHALASLSFPLLADRAAPLVSQR
jgi:hypothetical protein